MSTIITRTDYGGVDYVGESTPTDNWDGKTWYKPSTNELYAYDSSTSSYVLLNNFKWYIEPINGDRGVQYSAKYSDTSNSYGYRYVTISTHSDATDLTSISSSLLDYGCTVSNGVSNNARYSAGNGLSGSNTIYNDYRIDTLSSAVTQGNYSSSLSQSYGASNGTNDLGLVIAGTGKDYHFNVTLSTQSTSSSIPGLGNTRGCSGNTCNGIYDRYLKCFGLSTSSTFLDSYDPITISTGSFSTVSLNLGINCYDLASNGCSNDIYDRASIPGGVTDISGTIRSNNNRFLSISINSTSLTISNLIYSKNAAFNSSNGIGDKAIYYYGYNSSSTQRQTREYYTISTNSNSISIPNAAYADALTGSSSNGAL